MVKVVKTLDLESADNGRYGSIESIRALLNFFVASSSIPFPFHT